MIPEGLSIYWQGDKITYGSEWWDVRNSEFGTLECPQCGRHVDAISQSNHYDWQLAPCFHPLNRRVYSLLIHEDSLGWSFQRLDGQPTPAQERRAHLAELASDSPAARRCIAFSPDRSSGQYTMFTDLYGAMVTVRHSSLATQPALWIFVRDGDVEDNATGGALHLCRAMAKEVRDALTRFLNEDVDHRDKCEYEASLPKITD